MMMIIMTMILSLSLSMFCKMLFTSAFPLLRTNNNYSNHLYPHSINFLISPRESVVIYMYQPNIPYRNDNDDDVHSDDDDDNDDDDATSAGNHRNVSDQEMLTTRAKQSQRLIRLAFATSMIFATTSFLVSVPHVVDAIATTSMSTTSSVQRTTTSAAETEATTTAQINQLDAIVRTNTKNDETISGFVAGAALTVTKTLVKYPMDTATVRLQMPNTTYTIDQPLQLFHNAYIGIQTPLLSNIPAGAVFFAVKDTVSSTLQSIATTTTTMTSTSTIATTTVFASAIASAVPDDVILSFQSFFLLIQQLCISSRTFRTCIAVAIAQIPYWIVRNPSEVIKTKEQATGKVTVGIQNNNNNTTTAAWDDQIGMYYTGYWENVIYAYPADVLKFVCYEQLSSSNLHLFATTENDNDNINNNLQSAIESALYGAIATALAQYITTPLDVVRNRVMANLTTSNATFIPKMVATTTLSSIRLSDFSNATLTEPLNSTVSVADNSKPPSTSLSFLTTYVRSIIRLGQEEGWGGLLAGATPRLLKAFISGAIQFATYEETKQALITFLSHK